MDAYRAPFATPPVPAPGTVLWNTQFSMTVSGAGKTGQIYGWYVEGKSPSFVRLQDAYIISKLTGNRESLAAYGLVYEKIGDLNEIDTVPPNALIRLGITWTTPLSPQQFMDQWGRMELVITYNDNQKFVWEYGQDYVRDRVGTIVVGSFGPEVTRKKASP